MLVLYNFAKVFDKPEDYGDIKRIFERDFFTCECLESPVSICGCE